MPVVAKLISGFYLKLFKNYICKWFVKYCHWCCKAILIENITINQEVAMEISVEDIILNLIRIRRLQEVWHQNQTAFKLEILHYINDKRTNLNCLKGLLYAVWKLK